MYTSTLLRFHHRSPANARTSITPPALPPPSESTSTTTTAAATTTTTARFNTSTCTDQLPSPQPTYSHSCITSFAHFTKALVLMYTSTLLRFHHRSPATARTSITPPALPPPSESTSITTTTTTAATTTTTTARCIAGFRLICITARRLAQHPLHSHLPQPSSADVMTTKDGHRDGH
ncbi:hypothetical protein SprV_0200761800 [Sparganum proliferum]